MSTTHSSIIFLLSNSLTKVSIISSLFKETIQVKYEKDNLNICRLLLTVLILAPLLRSSWVMSYFPNETANNNGDHSSCKLILTSVPTKT